MRVLNFSRTLFAAVAIVALNGCSYSSEDTCELWCEQVNRCEDREPIDCEEGSEAMTTCVDSVEDVSEDCQDAWAGYYACLSDVDSCSGTEQDRECGSEYGDVIENCAGEENPIPRP
jgi:hypothetical protein